MKNWIRSPNRQLVNKDRSGSVFTMVIIVGSLLAMITVGSLRMTIFANRMTGRSHSYHQALAVAEAGLERAINEMNEGRAGGAGWSRTETVSTHTGTTIGQFVSIECKKGNWVRGKDEREIAQARWMEMIASHGGLVGFSVGELPE